MDSERHSVRIVLDGRVQGVGFRPFVYRLAHRHALDGWVRNDGGRVVILAAGAPESIDRFRRDLIADAPPLARPRELSCEPVPATDTSGFAVVASVAAGDADVHVPPDQFACDDCLREMRDPTDRRYRYPFINCTQCGPRYTLIAALPYDRPNTSMTGFTLCPACRSEYENPLDRRFHAEPIACPACGPKLTFAAQGKSVATGEAITAAVAKLRSGAVIAVKGIGGYHLLCDARNDATVQRLRERKPRPDKPLAVMFPQQGPDGLAALRRDLDPGPLEAARLTSPERPIVLCQKGEGCRLADAIAPGLEEVGAMLPYSPLHHLILEAFDAPLVATSGNVGGEPVITEARDAEARLARVAEGYLHHDRPILRPADDSVVRRIGGAVRPLRLGRGSAPLELPLPSPLPEPLLAVGGHMKNTVALAWEDRLVVSPHIGDLDARRGREVFAQVIDDLQRLYGIRAAGVVTDAHPGYAGRRWAERSGLPVTPVYHHRAHAAALYGEHSGRGDWLVFTWDGVGYGEDNTLWGGEALWGRPGRWRRVGSLRPFRLPGGEAGRAPWRAALGLYWEAGRPWAGAPGDTRLLHEAWQRGINSPFSSAAGRLFDAAAARLGLVENASFEGQGPMYLEAIARSGPIVDLPLTADGELLRIDWTPLLPMLDDGRLDVAERAGSFHDSLAAAAAALARRLREQYAFDTVGLTGGCFQNRRLSEQLAVGLEARGFGVQMAERIPCNDGGLSAGQLFETAALLNGN